VAPAGAERYDMGMSNQDEARAARLAAALRDNLRRRKAQARAAADVGTDAGTPATPPLPVMRGPDEP
jgi:hypothetical protein